MDNGVFVCSFDSCEKIFKKRSRLIAHIRSHSGEKPYVCVYDDCNKRYARAAHLKRHEESVHRSIAVQKNHEGNSDLDSGDELKGRSSHKLYKCAYADCGKVFKKHKLLRGHVNCVHSGSSQYMCPHEGCGKSFWCASKLRRHGKVHEGYRCDVEGCGAVLLRWTALRKHKLMEHKPECKCSVCGKTFGQKSWLKQHLLVHSEGRQMFECPRENCGRSYLDLRNLNAHLRSYHDGKRFPCSHSDCDRTFTTKQKLQQHLNLHDPNRPPPKKRVHKGGRKRNMAATLSGYNPRNVEIDLELLPFQPEDEVSMTEVEPAGPQPMDQNGTAELSADRCLAGSRGMVSQTEDDATLSVPNPGASQLCLQESAPAGVLHGLSHGPRACSAEGRLDSTEAFLMSVGSPSMDVLELIIPAGVQGPVSVNPASEESPSLQPPGGVDPGSSIETAASCRLELTSLDSLNEQHVFISGVFGESVGKGSSEGVKGAVNISVHSERPPLPAQGLPPQSERRAGACAVLTSGGDPAVQDSLPCDGAQEVPELLFDQAVLSKPVVFSGDLITDAIVQVLADCDRR